MSKLQNRRAIVKSAAALVASCAVSPSAGALARLSDVASPALKNLKSRRAVDGMSVNIADGESVTTYTFSEQDYSGTIREDVRRYVLIAPAFDESGRSGAWIRDIPDKRVKPEWFVAEDEDIRIDAGPAIRRALIINLTLGDHSVHLSQRYVVDCDPASNLKAGRFGYSILVPGNTTLECDEEAQIVQAKNAPSWCRTVSFSGSSNINVIGHLRIDGNVDNINADLNNEHMHGLFIFNCNRITIEKLTIENCRGDNLFIGGSSENSPSRDITISWFKGVRAGRKNLVWQYYDDIYFKSVFLDNRDGGSNAGGPLNAADKHSFDVEPDRFSGRVRHYGRIDRLTTRGTGNDFTAGRTAQKASSLIVDIGYFEMNVSGNSDLISAWTQYASTVNIETWRVTGLANANSPILLLYAARLNVTDAQIIGSTRSAWSFMIEISAKGQNFPIANFGTLSLENKVGAGVECRNSQLTIGKYFANTARMAGWSRSTSKFSGIKPRVWIKNLYLDNRSRKMTSNYAWLISRAAGANRVENRFDVVRYKSSAGDKLKCIIQGGTNAKTGLSMGRFENRSKLANICWR